MYYCSDIFIGILLLVLLFVLVAVRVVGTQVTEYFKGTEYFKVKIGENRRLDICISSSISLDFSLQGFSVLRFQVSFLRFFAY